MKFKIGQNTIASRISQLIKIVPKNPSHPILANILVKATKDVLTLSAFDLSIGLELTIPAEVKEEGKLTFPASLLNEIISRLPNEDVIVATKDHEINLQCGSGKYKLSGINSEEYPSLPELSKADAFTVPAEALRKGLAGTLFCASTDESKQILNGVNLSGSEDGLKFAATDGHRLAVLGIPEVVTEEFQLTIPSNGLRQLKGMIDKLGCDLRVTTDRSQIMFEVPTESGADKLYCRLLEGTYPNYTQLMPTKFERSLTCDRQALLSACDRIAVIAAAKNNIVKLVCAEDWLTVTAEVSDVGGGQEKIEALFGGDNFEIGLNVKYFTEGLKAMHCDTVQINMNGETMPMVVAPVTGDRFSYLLMPIQIRG